MTALESKVVDFINKRLFTETKHVLFQDLIHQFKIGPSNAKHLMYRYYKETKGVKYSCIIVCCYDDGKIEVVHDVEVRDREHVVDCFIYAFNPMEQFIPINQATDQRDCLTIRNVHTLQGGVSLRAKTVHVEKLPEPSVVVQRSKTVPEQPKVAKSKEIGLKSTALLAKMRKEREDKEKERQQELQKRRNADKARQLQNNPKMKAQIEELNNLFDEDEQEEESEEVPPVKQEEVTENSDKKELEDLLETTAEDSLMETPKQENPVENAKDTSYVDEDGYIVTKTTTSSTPAKVSSPAQISKRKNTLTLPAKKKQRTLEGFFKKSK